MDLLAPRDPTTVYKVGDYIGGGLYRIQAILGGREARGGVRSGMGVVYVVRDAYTQEDLVLKSFQERFVSTRTAREAFLREAYAWMLLDPHPNVVRAQNAWTFSGRPYLLLEYVKPDSQGRNTLRQFLSGQPLPVTQILRWATQFCWGIEHAYAHGVMCHRDIKPDNLMIDTSQQLKIADFGLAGVLEANSIDGEVIGPAEETRLSVIRVGKGVVCGTRGYIAPEILAGAGADLRSDLFSFGVVLHQMANGSRRPSANGPGDAAFIPPSHRCLQGVIEQCLRSDPAARFSNFGELRQELAALLHDLKHEPVVVKQAVGLITIERYNRGLALMHLQRHKEAEVILTEIVETPPQRQSDWWARGLALSTLWRDEEAMESFRRALALDPSDVNSWYNLACGLINTAGHVDARIAAERYREALTCLERAVKLLPSYADAWSSLGFCKDRLGHADALACMDRALELDPGLVDAWHSRSLALESAGRLEEAVSSVTRALDLDPYNENMWNSRANYLSSLGRLEEALHDLDRAIELGPGYYGFRPWWTRAKIYAKLCTRNPIPEDSVQEAVRSYNEARRLSPPVATFYEERAQFLEQIGQLAEAVEGYQEALQRNPKLVSALVACGRLYLRLSKPEQAVDRLSIATELDPRCVEAWELCGVALLTLGRDGEAARYSLRATALTSTRGRVWREAATVLLNRAKRLLTRRNAV